MNEKRESFVEFMVKNTFIPKKEIKKVFEKHGLRIERILTKMDVKNANIVTEKKEKLWFGDLNLKDDTEKILKVAKELNLKLYVLREMDCRFDTEHNPDLSKAVWNTDLEVA